jgi:hypothetical protein
VLASLPTSSRHRHSPPTEILYQARDTAEALMNAGLRAVAKARAGGHKISDADSVALVTAFMNAAASDYAVHARMKFEEENLGR